MAAIPGPARLPPQPRETGRRVHGFLAILLGAHSRESGRRRRAMTSRSPEALRERIGQRSSGLPAVGAPYAVALASLDEGARAAYRSANRKAGDIGSGPTAIEVACKAGIAEKTAPQVVRSLRVSHRGRERRRDAANLRYCARRSAIPTHSRSLPDWFGYRASNAWRPTWQRFASGARLVSTAFAPGPDQGSSKPILVPRPVRTIRSNGFRQLSVERGTDLCELCA
jgi:hypothetical protein